MTSSYRRQDQCCAASVSVIVTLRYAQRLSTNLMEKPTKLQGAHHSLNAPETKVDPTDYKSRREFMSAVKTRNQSSPRPSLDCNTAGPRDALT